MKPSSGPNARMLSTCSCITSNSTWWMPCRVPSQRFSNASNCTYITAKLSNPASRPKVSTLSPRQRKSPFVAVPNHRLPFESRAMALIARAGTVLTRVNRVSAVKDVTNNPLSVAHQSVSPATNKAFADRPTKEV